MQRKLLLFGGTGFVGSNVAVRALLHGYKVVVASRTGAPLPNSPLETLYDRVRQIGGQRAAQEALCPDSSAAAAGPLDLNAGDELMKMAEGVGEADALEFVSLDACSRQQVFNFLHDHPDAVGVISAVGLLTRDYHLARQMNGDPNTHIAAGMCHPKLLPNAKKFVYVSAEPYNKYFPYIIGHKKMLKGYFHGKHIAEEAVLKNLGGRGLVLRPGFIYGTRFVSLSTAAGTGAVLALPLWLVGKPLDWALSAVGGKRLFVPPTDVEVLAEAAVRACEWATIADKNVSGIADVYKMKEMVAAPQGPAAAKAQTEKDLSEKQKEKKSG